MVTQTSNPGGEFDGPRFRVTDKRKRLDVDERIESTFVGQAHFAGTGPEGATCHQCKFWWNGFECGKWPPSYHKKTGELRKARCNYPVRGKSPRRIPAVAPACRLFDPVAEAPPLMNPDAKSEATPK